MEHIKTAGIPSFFIMQDIQLTYHFTLSVLDIPAYMCYASNSLKIK